MLVKRNMAAAIALLLLVIPSVRMVRAQEEDHAGTKALAGTAADLIKAGKLEEAVASLRRPERPLDALGATNILIRHYYWKEKNLPVVVELAESAIAFGRAVAEALADAEQKARILGSVKAIAYNLASFTWPGWGEDGMVITPDQRQRGRHAADLNLRLAQQLEKDPQAISAAFWMVGAHQLTDQRAEAAVASFKRARDYSEKAGDLAGKALNDGFIGIALALCGRTTEGLKVARMAVAALKSLGGEDATFYAEQVKDVYRRLVEGESGAAVKARVIRHGPVTITLPPGDFVALFHIVDQLSAFRPSCRPDYRRHLSLSSEEEAALARYASIRQRTGDDLEKFLYGAGTLDDGLFAAAEKDVLEPAEVIVLTQTFTALKPRVAQLMAENRDVLAEFERALAGREFGAAVERFAKFIGAESHEFEVYPVPTPGSEVAVTRRRGRWVVEIPRDGKAVAAVLEEVAVALLSPRNDQLVAAAEQSPGLSVAMLTEGIAAAFADGLHRPTPVNPKIVQAYGAALRPVLFTAMREGSFEDFLEQAGMVFTSLAETPGKDRGK